MQVAITDLIPHPAVFRDPEPQPKRPDNWKPSLPTIERVSTLGPACHLSRRPQPMQPLTGRERTWSEGKTLLTYKESKVRVSDKPVAEMTVQELIDTQKRELPSISREAWKLTGQGILSADLPIENGFTIAERLPDDHDLKTTWKTTIPVAEMTDEQRAAYEEFCANATRHTGFTPYVTVDPETADKIEWERRVTREPAMQVTSMGRAPDGSMRVNISGVQLTTDEYKERAKNFLRWIIGSWGKVPQPEDLTAKRLEAEQARAFMRENNIGIPANWFEDIYLMKDDDPYRNEFFEPLLHTSIEVIINEDDIEEAREKAAKGEIDWSKVPEPIVGYNTRNSKRVALMSKGERHDAFYRGTMGNPVEVGEDFTDQVLFNHMPYTEKLLSDLFTRITGAITETSIWDKETE